MGINTETEQEGELQIGPTDLGMVRIFLKSGEFELPMDFSPEEAQDIAAEILAAAEIASSLAKD